MPNITVARSAAIAAALASALGMAACSSSSPQPTPTPTVPATSASPSPSRTMSTVEFDKTMQGDLADVGCYPGGVDGKIGPETDAAIREFQAAKGMEVTGELTPETVAALKKAAAQGETVCTQTASPTATVTPSGPTCTATSLGAVLPSGTIITNYACADGWAGGWSETKAGQPAPDVWFAQVENNAWVYVAPDQVCGTASAGMPARVLKFCQT